MIKTTYPTWLQSLTQRPAPPYLLPGLLSVVTFVFACACASVLPARAETPTHTGATAAQATEPCELAGTSGLTLPVINQGEAPAVSQWRPYQLVFTAATSYDNPYTDVIVTAEFSGPNGQVMTVGGFWNGGSEFVVRFTPPAPGDWSYTVSAAPADPGLAQSGEFTVEAAPAQEPGFVRRDPQNPYSFVRDNGDRYFMMGQTYYDLIRTACANAAWDEGVVKSAEYGINKIRIFVHSLGFGPDHTHPDYYPAVYAFMGDDHDQINLAYWQRLDEVVLSLAEQGMIADLILFMKPSVTDDDLAFGTQEQDERYVRYILARYAALPNVIWCITNEWEYTGRGPAYWDVIGTLVRNEDPWLQQGDALRPLSIHNKTNGKLGGIFQFFESEWPVHAILQYGVRNGQFEYGDEWAHYSIAQNWGHEMPVVNDEYGYIGERTPVNLTRDQHRFTLWGLVTSGGYGAAGDSRIFAEGPNGEPARVIMTGSWHEAREYDDIETLVRFWTTRGIPYWEMRPQQAVIQETPRTYALGIEGEEYVVYAAAGGSIDLALPPGKYGVLEFDPRYGSSKLRADIAGGEPATITLPDDRDWVLHITRQAP